MKIETVIGLEVHAQLKTETKLFCRCPNLFGAEPNTLICPTCLGLPGALPVTNKEAIAFAIRIGMALGSKVHRHSVFARKNYFYPDLPKGYQISQFNKPICEGGTLSVVIEEKEKLVRIHRAHLEEDAGKLLHGDNLENQGGSLVDLNRAGVPLVEIVSEPDLRSPEEASAYLKKLRSILRYLGVCDGNMEEGSLRCDANISVRPQGQENLGEKVEIKNMNSFKNVQRALGYEIERQSEMLRAGEEILQETRLFNPDQGVTKPMRSKEEAHDYRYFPEPDLLPLQLEDSFLSQQKDFLPELPDNRRARFTKEFGLPAYDAEVLTAEKEMADFFEATLENLEKKEKAKSVSNFIMAEIMRIANAQGKSVSELQITAEKMAGLFSLMDKGIVSGKIAKELVDLMEETGKSAKELVKEKGLEQISDEDGLAKIAREIIEKNPGQVAQYRSGKDKLFGFFVGQVMKATKGKANPGIVNQILKKELSK